MQWAPGFHIPDTDGYSVTSDNNTYTYHHADLDSPTSDKYITSADRYPDINIFSNYNSTQPSQDKFSIQEPWNNRP